MTTKQKDWRYEIVIFERPGFPIKGYWVVDANGIHRLMKQLDPDKILSQARAEERREVLEEKRIELDSIVNAHLWGDYGLSTREVYEGCVKFLNELKEEIARLTQIKNEL